jgi:hypothetical protein
MVVEKAVKYSENEGKGKISFESLKRALAEMRVRIPIKEKEVEEIQRPERVLSQTQSIGTPSAKRIKENISSFHKKLQADKNWLIHKRKGIEKAKALTFKMEKQLAR